MGNFTESQVLILALIATSNIILIVIAFVLLFSGRKTEKNIYKEPTIKPEPKKITEYYKEETKPEVKRDSVVNTEEISEKQITIDDIEENIIDEEIDYENYTIPNGEYSDEEYKYATIEEFENAQEENAIISYKELLKLKNQNNSIIEEFDEPVIKEKVSKTYNNTNYGTGEFISPVFGRMNNSSYEYTKAEPTPIAKQEKIRYNSAPIRNQVSKQDSNTEFLNALKEFRNNL